MEMVDLEDTVEAIRNLTENFGEQQAEYPLIINKPIFKKFKASLGQFVTQLISQCQHSIVYDENMMDILISWIIGLSDSQVRAFRHTATFIGMKIVSGLINVAIKVSIEQDNTQRHMDSEIAKPVAKRSREKIEKLQKKRRELRTNVADLQEMMHRIYLGIFVHRYRDSRSEIRAICIAEMGQWVNKYSTYFLDQNYLKYLGWTLYDKIAEVRMEVLKGLQELYKNEDYVDQLSSFTCRFKNRLVEMALDTDTEVAMLAIKVVSLLYKYNVLEDDCSQVEQLVFCDQKRMAHAAGEFLALRIKRLSIEASPKKIKKGTRDQYLRQMNIKAIIGFFVKTEIHEHCAYIVDSLWDHTDLLKDWKTMTNMLLDTNCLIELDDQDETSIIDLMTSCCKMAATGEAPPGRHQNKKQSGKERRILQEDTKTLSIHFMEKLPQLLNKYGADVEKANHLLTIPQYFVLEAYAESGLSKNFQDLLYHLEDIVLKQVDPELLETCSKTYRTLVDAEYTFKQTADVGLIKLMDQIVEKLRHSLKDGIPTSDVDRESPGYFNILTNLKRLSVFYKHHDLADWDLYDCLNSIVEQAVDPQGSVDSEVLTQAVQSINMLCLKSLLSLNHQEPDKTDLKILRRRIKMFMKQLESLLQLGSDVAVQIGAFQILCDLLVYFSKQLLNNAPLLAPIVSEADGALQLCMRDFVLVRVFDNLEAITGGDDDEDEDMRTQELYNARVMLAGLCKLIGFGMFEMKLAAPIFSQFLRANNELSDIIKYLMVKCKEINLIAFSKTLFESLRLQFEQCMNQHGDEVEFNKIKELAHQFALQIGVNITQDNPRKSCITLHGEGIKFALSSTSDSDDLDSEQQMPDVPEVPTNLMFLEILHEFIYRLNKIDRKPVLKYLDEVAGDMIHKKGNVWMPLRTYRNGLISKGNDTTRFPQDTLDMDDEEEVVMETR